MALQGLRKLNTRFKRDRVIAESIARSTTVPAGKTSASSKEEIKDTLGVGEYDSVATQAYVDDKYSQDRYEKDTVSSQWFFNNNQHEWSVMHNLGYYPDVTTLALISGDDYEEFDAYVKHNSVNDLTVICTGTTTGKLLLR
jgi:hypothetical protein